jgi:alkanesulfonate monooxygenase SsuD/methylene tetrahydromethanopterin reductase-like flavin-dependent oxidoreductase (luciferase family)
MKFGVLYDLRNPSDARWHEPWPSYYAGAFEHIAEMDRLGFHSIGFTEHHGDPDGYNPAMIAAMTGAAMCTKRVSIGSNIIVLPHHHPVMLAEQLAVVDVISNGRLRVGFGPGGPFDMESRMLGIDPKHRPSRLEEALEIILRAWAEDEPFTFRGRRFEFEDVWINPKPVQRPRPGVFLTALLAEAPMERVLRMGVDVSGMGGTFFCAADRPSWTAWRDLWLAVCARHGKDPAGIACHVFATCFVTEDPERAWAKHRESALHTVAYERQGERPYARVLDLPDDMEPEQLPGWQGMFMTPDQAVDALRASYHDGAPTELQLMAKRPSMSWEESAEHMRLFVEQVLPRLADLPGLTADVRPTVETA